MYLIFILIIYICDDSVSLKQKWENRFIAISQRLDVGNRYQDVMVKFNEEIILQSKQLLKASGVGLTLNACKKLNNPCFLCT